MGNNKAYTQVEEIIISLSNLGKLDLATLDVIGRAFGFIDIDNGGSCGLRTNDGHDLEQVVLDLVDPDWEPGELPENEEDKEEWERWVRSTHFDQITSERWHW